jgi:hypothetical protein
MLGWIGAAIFAGILIAWLVAFCLDPEAFNSGSRR